MIRINENTLRKIIRETIESLLFEGAIDREFHYTSLYGLFGIMYENRFWLTPNEEEYNNYCGDNINHLSLSRTRTNTQGYQYGVYAAEEGGLSRSPHRSYARIEFDGRKLSSIRGAKIRPFDYYNHLYNSESGRQTHTDYYDDRINHPLGSRRQFWAQSEDRIESKDKYIENAIKYIVRIDVMVKDTEDDEYKKIVKYLSEHPEWKRLVFFHTENRTFNHPL